MAATRTSSDFLMFSSSLPGPSAKRSVHVRNLRAPAMRSRRASPGQRIMLRTADRCDEFPSPHGFACAEDHIGYQKTITFLDRELRRSLHASGQLPTSALCQKQTCSLILFNHFVGAGEERFGNRNAERFGGLQVDVQIKFGGLLHGQFTWLRTFQYPVDIARGTAEKVSVARAITH